MMPHIIKIISINEKQGVKIWFGVFAMHNDEEVCRCKFHSQAVYLRKLLTRSGDVTPASTNQPLDATKHVS